VRIGERTAWDISQQKKGDTRYLDYYEGISPSHNGKREGGPRKGGSPVNSEESFFEPTQKKKGSCFFPVLEGGGPAVAP